MGEMNVILSLDNYSIFRNNNYYLCVPNEESDFYHVFMGFSLQDLTNLSEDDLFMEIRKIGDSINALYKNGIYVLPIISPILLEEAANENDDRQYNYILNKIIQPITFDVYNIFKKQRKTVSQIIKMIKQNDMDTKIIGWLSMKLGNNFIKEIIFDTSNDVSTTPMEIMESVFHTSNADTIFIDYRDNDIQNNKNEECISDTLKPAFSPGFSKLGFIIMILFISLVLGIILGYMILK